MQRKRRNPRRALTPDQQELVKQWRRLAAGIVRKFAARNCGIDEEELHSAGMEALTIAALHYNPRKYQPGTKKHYAFGSYLGQVMQQRLIDEVYRQRSSGLSKLKSALRSHRVANGDAPNVTTNWEFSEVAQVESEKEEQDRQNAVLLDGLLGRLEPEEAEVVRRIELEGCKFRDLVWFGEAGYERHLRKLHRSGMRKLMQMGQR